MSLSTRILAAVDRAKQSMGDLIVPATIVQTRNSGYSAATMTPMQTVESIDIDGFVGSWTEGELRDYVARNTSMDVRADDVAFFVFPTSADPRVDDVVSLDGSKYLVKGVLPYLAGTSVALTLLQLRK